MKLPRILGFLFAAAMTFPTTSWTRAQQTTSTLPEAGISEHPNEVYAITGASITVEPGKKIENGTLVIRDGKISEVGSEVTIPPEARVIELRGKHIYPGLVDAGIESDLPPAATVPGVAHWSREITPERSLAQEITPASTESLFGKLRKAGITTALVSPRDGIIKGQSAVFSTGDLPTQEALLRSNAALHVRLTVSRGRGRDSYPSSPMGAVALARQTFLDAQWYAAAHQAYRTQPGLAKPDDNLALQSLTQAIASGQPVVFDTLNEQYSLRADSFGREFGLQVVLKGSGQEYQLLQPIAKLNRTIIVPVNFPKPPAVQSFEQAIDVELEELTHWELAPENPARLRQAGVPILLTSFGLTDPSEFLPNVRKAVTRGLSKDDALAAMTVEPAKFLGVEATCGSLRQGQWANLIVASADLFDDACKVEEVWSRGRRPENAEKSTASMDGTWQIAWTGGEHPNLKLHLEIKDSLGKPNAAVRVPSSDDEPAKTEPKDAPEKSAESPKDKGAGPSKKESKLKNLKVESNTLTGVVAAGNLDESLKGNGYLSVTFLDSKSPSQARLLGSIVWPNGTMASFSAKRDSSSDAKSDLAKDAEKSDSKPKKEEAKDAAVAKILSPILYPPGTMGREAIPEQHDVVLFKDTTLWTCGPDGLLKNVDLLVRRGKIDAIGAELEVPENAHVVDASKWQISPGLIDCHSHMATDSGINEATQAVTAEVRIGDFIDAGDITIYRQLAGGLTTANVLHGSANPIGGQNQVIKLRWGAPYEELKFKQAPAGIKFALGENVKQSNWELSTRSRYPQSRMGVEQLFRERFNAAQQYSASWDRWRENPQGLPPRRDLELDAIAEIVDGKRWIHCHSYRQDEILGLLRVLDEYGITIGSLQHILEGYKVADEMAKHGATASSFSDWWNYKFEVFDAIPYNGALMHRRGIVVSFNSDDNELGRHMNHEAAKAVKYGGVEPMEALKFVTLNPAIQLRIDEHVGSIEIGKDADLAIWTGSPLSPMSRCEQTWIDGRKYFDRSQDVEDRKRDAQLHRALVQKVIESGEPGSQRSSLADDPSRLWPHHDEFCHDHHDEDHDHAMEHDHDH
jgi:N-acetylglucosamine-6-phosphate deacetylase